MFKQAIQNKPWCTFVCIFDKDALTLAIAETLSAKSNNTSEMQGSEYTDSYANKKSFSG